MADFQTVPGPDMLSRVVFCGEVRFVDLALRARRARCAAPKREIHEPDLPAEEGWQSGLTHRF